MQLKSRKRSGQEGFCHTLIEAQLRLSKGIHEEHASLSSSRVAARDSKNSMLQAGCSTTHFEELGGSYSSDVFLIADYPI